MDYNPIRYLNRSYRRDELAGVYRASKAALVTPLRDGMNLVAKEYIASQAPEDPGVLILSRFAGAARQLKDALIINPNSPEEISGRPDPGAEHGPGRAQAAVRKPDRQRHPARTSPPGATTSWPSCATRRRPRSSRTAPSS